MKKFDLIKEPWIECLMPGGATEEFGLLDVLTKAHEIREIVGDSPLVTVSLHRLLLAILHRNFGPKTFDDWKNLWRMGFWDAATLQTYFDGDNCRDRFNLFDDERPFYQYPQVTKKGAADSDKLTVETLMQEKATGANATLFDHSFRHKQQAYSPAVAARYLVARQSFSLAGGVSHPFNLSNGLLVKGFSLLAVGDNLFETLALNLVIYDRGDKPMPSQDEDGVCLDKPFWERDGLEAATERDREGTLPLGYLDYLTWQSRRVKLLPEPNFESVKFCQLQQNFKLRESHNIFDPFKVYATGENGFYALDFKTDKALWRNSHTIFQQKGLLGDNKHLTQHLAKISEAVSSGEIEGRREYSFSIIGIINDQANVETWMHETLPIPLDYFDDNNLTALLETAVKFAQDIGDKLRIGIKELATLLNANPADFAATAIYWSTLELDFQDLLSGLPGSQDAATRKWFKTVDETAESAFRQTTNSLSGAAAEQKATVEAFKKFRGERAKLLSGNSVYKEILLEPKIKGDNQ